MTELPTLVTVQDHARRPGLYALLSLVCLLLAGETLAAEKLPQTERKNTSPTMAKFYKVDGSGRSKSDRVSVPTLANPEEPVEAASTTNKPADAEATPKRSAGRSADAKQKGPAKTRSITINRDKQRYNAQDAWRCERAGFYYTKDGRCVAPAPALRLP